VSEALQVAVAAAPAIVIAHGGRDDSEALKLCRALRKFEAGRNAYFILATEEREPADLLALLNGGVDDYLTVPCTEGAGLVRVRAAQRLLELRARLAAQEKALQEHLAELSVANRKLHRAAMTDELTQLPNRRFAEESLKEEWEGATAHDEDLSLIFADIDHFKRVNDAYGHLIGDMVLAAVGRTFRRELRTSDLPCRLGGEEFLVICPRTNLEGARSCAERLRDRVASQMIEIAGTKHRVTLSLGIATRRNGPACVRSLDALFQAADDAVYAAKRSGRNRVSIGYAPALERGEGPANGRE
jgi:diguanylate cyclase (GGDEF)-like protein